MAASTSEASSDFAKFDRFCSENPGIFDYVRRFGDSASRVSESSRPEDIRSLIQNLRSIPAPSSAATGTFPTPSAAFPTYSSVATSSRVETSTSRTFPRALDTAAVCDDFVRATKVGAFYSIEVDEEDYQKGVDRYKQSIIGRVFYPPKDRPRSIELLRARLKDVWGISSEIRVVPLGKGFYNIQFLNLEEKTRVFSRSVWNLNPGSISLRRWTPDFNPYKLNSSIAEVWVRIYELSLEYWSPKLILGIASAVGNPVKIDERSTDGSLGHFTRVLVEVDLKNSLQERVMVVRKDLSFFVGIRYENLPAFCTNCCITGHNVAACRFRKGPEGGADKPRRPKSPRNQLLLKDSPHVGNTSDGDKTMEKDAGVSAGGSMDRGDDADMIVGSSDMVVSKVHNEVVVTHSSGVDTPVISTGFASFVKTSNAFSVLPDEGMLSNPQPPDKTLELDKGDSKRNKMEQPKPVKSILKKSAIPSSEGVIVVPATSGPPFKAMNVAATGAWTGHPQTDKLPKHSSSDVGQ